MTWVFIAIFVTYIAWAVVYAVAMNRSSKQNERVISELLDSHRKGMEQIIKVSMSKNVNEYATAEKISSLVQDEKIKEELPEYLPMEAADDDVFTKMMKLQIHADKEEGNEVNG